MARDESRMSIEFDGLIAIVNLAAGDYPPLEIVVPHWIKDVRIEAAKEGVRIDPDGKRGQSTPGILIRRAEPREILCGGCFGILEKHGDQA